MMVITTLAAHTVLSGGGKVPGAAAAKRVAADRVKPAAAPKTCPAPSSRLIRAAPGAEGSRTVALTFDDGPGPWTPKVLEVLHQKNVRATFFVVGKHAATQRQTLRIIVSAGNALENHTWSHRVPSRSTGWEAESLATELRRTRRELVAATGQAPCFFRPPGGIVTGARKVSRAAGLSIVLWSVDTRDWAGQHATDVSLIRKRARLGLTQKHPVVLLHDGGGYRGATVRALGLIVDDYRAHGYQFVTLDGRT
jgi:peptidoglycan/xylan/chitin deacetylase (PgdA/CDA1 family)